MSHARGSVSTLPVILLGIMLSSAFFFSGFRTVSASGLCVNETGSNGCYSSIQAAVNSALPGQVISLGGSTFTEQLSILKNITIVSSGSWTPTIRTPSALVTDSFGLRTILKIGGGATVSISGVTILGPGSGTCDNVAAGVAVLQNSNLILSNSVVTGTRVNQTRACSEALGIMVGNSALGQAGHANLVHDTILAYQTVGIVVDGVGSEATIRNTLVSDKGTSTSMATQGIRISNGATGFVGWSEIAGNACNLPSCGSNYERQRQAAGVVLDNSGNNVILTRNSIHDNDIGVYTHLNRLSTAQIGSNTILNNRYENLLLGQGQTIVSGNLIEGGNIGVAVASFNGDTSNANAVLSLNSIYGTRIGMLTTDQNTVYSTYPVLTAAFNNIAGNAIGILDTASSIVSAQDNWWGDISGPYDKGPVNDRCGLSLVNPTGIGQSVSECVYYVPWLGMPVNPTVRVYGDSVNTLTVNSTTGTFALIYTSTALPSYCAGAGSQMTSGYIAISAACSQGGSVNIIGLTGYGIQGLYWTKGYQQYQLSMSSLYPQTPSRQISTAPPPSQVYSSSYTPYR